MQVKEAEMHRRLHSAAPGLKTSLCRGWIYVQMVSGYWFWSVMTGFSSTGSYEVGVFWVSSFASSSPAFIMLPSSTCPSPPVPHCLLPLSVGSHSLPPPLSDLQRSHSCKFAWFWGRSASWFSHRWFTCSKMFPEFLECSPFWILYIGNPDRWPALISPQSSLFPPGVGLQKLNAKLKPGISQKLKHLDILTPLNRTKSHVLSICIWSKGF